MLDSIAQAVLPKYPPVLSPNTLTEFDNHLDTQAMLMPWLDADGELVFLQTEEDDEPEGDDELNHATRTLVC